MISIAISVLEYDPETGIFRWKAEAGKKLAGKVAGTLHPHGYTRISINRKFYYAHRLAWLFTHGEWPKGHLDHRDGNPANNRIANLRVATSTQNMRNQKRRKDNRSGYKGVYWHGQNECFYARVHVDGKVIFSKGYPTAVLAAAEYERLAKQHYGEFARC